MTTKRPLVINIKKAVKNNLNCFFYMKTQDITAVPYFKANPILINLLTY